MLCHGSSAQSEQRSSPSHSAVSIKITLATLSTLPLFHVQDYSSRYNLHNSSSSSVSLIPIIFWVNYGYPCQCSSKTSPFLCSTAARRQERSAESGAMSWPRNRILTNQRRAPRPRDQLSTNQGPAWAGSWSLFSLFPRAELRLVTSLRLTATLRGTEEHITISTPEHPHTYNSN